MSNETITVRRAFISVSDRTGLAAFARFLANRGVELYATGGTASFLRENGIPVRPAQELTGVVEILSGKVKSLSPRLHAAILFDRSVAEESAHMEREGVPSVDLVVVNFYPFQNVTKTQSLSEAASLIDIGGPAAIRAAAKNSRWVVPLPEPGAYDKVIADALARPVEQGVRVSLELSRRLAARVFEITSSYDHMIAGHLHWAAAPAEGPRSEPPGAGSEKEAPGATAGTLADAIELKYRRAQALRYGENPHQKAAFYVASHEERGGHPLGRQLQGKELSFNNLLDLDAAVSTCREFEEAACAVIKHRNPSGVSRSSDVLTAYRLARDCDPLSAFGGVVAVNREVTAELASEMSSIFLEVIAAPGFSSGALKALSSKKNLRALELPPEMFAKPPSPGLIFRSGLVGLLVEEEDLLREDPERWKVVTRRSPEPEALAGLFFLWRVARQTVSNAIVIGRGDRTLGIGAGQTSRVDSVEIALRKAKRSGHDVTGAWLASDGFFPFRDSIDLAASAGIEAIVEPGGSVRDAECIAAAEEHGVVLCFTGRRCFKH